MLQLDIRVPANSSSRAGRTRRKSGMSCIFMSDRKLIPTPSSTIGSGGRNRGKTALRSGREFTPTMLTGWHGGWRWCRTRTLGGGCWRGLPAYNGRARRVLLLTGGCVTTTDRFPFDAGVKPGFQHSCHTFRAFHFIPPALPSLSLISGK